MGVRADGSAYCNRCDQTLSGVGVIFGLLASDVTEAGDIRQLLFCYDNQCRDQVLADHVLY